MLALCCTSSLILGCSEADGPLATAVEGDAALAYELQGAGATRHWEANAAVYWNGVAREMAIANRSPAPVAIRGYAIVSVAQYNAAVTAEKEKLQDEHPSVSAAIGAASVVALSYLYPARARALEARLDEFLAGPAWPGGEHQDAAAGEAIG